MKQKTKSTCRIGALFLAVVLCLTCAAPALALGESGVIRVSSAQELLALSRKCALDTWSQGKRVVLTADIMLDEVDGLPIPTFGGTFDGDGHTISGLALSGDLSPAGLFGILQPGGVIQNLQVNGTVVPGGAGETVGGIVGENYGLVENCSFTGNVSGVDCVGGITGVNGLTGKVTGCSVSGSLTGRSMTGGVAGKNLGVLSGCHSSAYVNITSADPGLDLSALKLEPTSELFTLRSLDTLNVATDTGGVAGYSSGMVLSCTNSGVVGYPHLGYNVGGVVGRGSGHTANCINEGQVFGRKDIGGIIGQAEPYIVLNLSGDLLARLRTELENLSNLVDAAVNEAESTVNGVSDSLTQIGGSVDEAVDYTERLTGHISDYGGSIITEIDRGSEILAGALDRLPAIGEKATALSELFSKGLDQLEKAVEELAKAENFGTAALEQLQAAGKELDKAAFQLEQGVGQIKDGLQQLRDAVHIGDQTGAGAALEQLRTGLNTTAAALEKAGSAIELAAETGAGEQPDWTGLWDGLREVALALHQEGAALENLAGHSAALQGNDMFQLPQLRAGLDEIVAGVKQIEAAHSQLRRGFRKLGDGLEELEQASRQLGDAADTLAGAVDLFGKASDRGTELLTSLTELFDYLATAEPIQFAPSDQQIEQEADALYDAVRVIGEGMENLNQTVRASSGRLADDVRAISGQAKRVTNTLLDGVYELENGSESPLSDTSEEDINAVTSGKVLSCVNRGVVNGDINVGGVAGAMAVEYELDPENELLVDDTPIYRREYELKAILQQCVNTGSITSRRNYAGSICGRQDMGLIIRCEGYGTVESENGDYVGGITGFTGGVLRESFAKCTLSGGKYIGGITGAASDDQGAGPVSNCYSLVQIAACEQYAGAIAGVDRGTFYHNRFVSSNLAGLDRISAAGRAEPISFGELQQVEGLPQPFRQLTLRFWVEDQVVKETVFDYGASFDDTVFPQIPPREGYFALWDATILQNLCFDTNVNAIYTPCLPALDSVQRRSDGRPVFLVEGSFRGEDSLTALLSQDSGSGAARPTAASRREALEVWELDIPEDGCRTHTIRYLSPTGDQNGLEVYQKRENGWERLQIESFGSYLRFQAEGTSPQLAIVSRTAIWWIWPAVVLVMLAAALAVQFLRRRRKHRKIVPLPEVKVEGTENTTVQDETPVPAAGQKKNRRKLGRGLVLLLLVLAVGAALWFRDGLKEGVAAYRLLEQYAAQEQMSAQITVQANVDGRQYRLVTELSRTQLEGKSVTCAEQYGVDLYYCDGKVYLENGQAFAVGGSFPNYPGLLERTVALYRASQITVFENSGERIYRITIQGPEALELVESLMPSAASYLERTDQVEIELVEREKTLSELRFACGVVLNREKTPVTLSVILCTEAVNQIPELPQVVREQIVSGGSEAIADETVFRLLEAWTRLNASDPLTAEVSIAADCGPLVLQDRLRLERTYFEGERVDRVEKNGRSYYFYGGSLLDDGDRHGDQLASVTEVLELAYQLCVNGKMTCEEKSGADLFSIQLDREGMEQIAGAALPEMKALDVNLEQGSIQLTVTEDGIQRVSISCSGSIQIVVAEAPVSLRVEISPVAEETEKPAALPEGVQSALKNMGV